MAKLRRGGLRQPVQSQNRSRWLVRTVATTVLLFLLVGLMPVASAHDATGHVGLTQWHSIVITLVGLGVVGGAVLFKRTTNISATLVVYGVLAGLTIAVIGAILFEGLSPDPSYTADSMPFPRAWYPALSLSVGLLVVVTSFAVGWLRWPTRPRYTFFGLLMGAWIAYPALIPGPASDIHPLGYALVIATPLMVGYIIWTDAGGVLRSILRDPVARRFGIGIALLSGLFFMSMSGYLSFFWEEGAPHETTVVVLPTVYQLVTWPTLEVALPHIPLFFAISIGIAIVVGLLSLLIGLNAALIARHWRVQEEAGMVQGTAGTAVVVGSCTCGCCGPFVAKVAILAAGPSFAAPLYWIFVDSASPLSAVFVVGSILLFTGSLVYSVGGARQPGYAPSVIPAD